MNDHTIDIKLICKFIFEQVIEMELANKITIKKMKYYNEWCTLLKIEPIFDLSDEIITFNWKFDSDTNNILRGPFENR